MELSFGVNKIQRVGKYSYFYSNSRYGSNTHKKNPRVAPQGGARGEDLAAEGLKTADSPLPLPPALAAVEIGRAHV